MAREVILIVDDDAGFRELVANVLRLEGFRIREAADGPQALALVAREPPSLVLLEVDIPGMSGHALCNRLRLDYGEQLPIVLVSGTRTKAFDRAAGLLIGADDYLLKPVDTEEFVSRVRRLTVRARGGKPRPPGRDGATRDRPHELTRREFEVLGLLANGFDQREIARRLVISESTVATHLQRILAKLDVKSRAQAVALASRERLFEIPNEADSKR